MRLLACLLALILVPPCFAQYGYDAPIHTPNFVDQPTFHPYQYYAPNYYYPAYPVYPAYSYPPVVDFSLNYGLGNPLALPVMQPTIRAINTPQWMRAQRNSFSPRAHEQWRRN